MESFFGILPFTTTEIFSDSGAEVFYGKQNIGTTIMLYHCLMNIVDYESLRFFPNAIF